MRAWEEFVKEQELELGPAAVEKWLRPLRVVHFDAGNLYLEAADSFQIGWFEEHIRPKIRKTLLNSNGRAIKVHLAIGGASAPAGSEKKREWKPALDLQGDTLDPTSTFDLFLPSSLDTMTLSLFRSILEKKESFNPVFLFGPPSCGKSHLLMAAAHFLKERGSRCLYVQAESFTEHMIAAIRNGAMRKFREIYRNHDVLLIDDIHVLGGRVSSQEELFHTFNALHGAKKLLIFSAKAPAASLIDIEPRLTSRFEWGISLPLHRLSSEELASLLALRERALQFPLPEGAARFLLTHFSSSPRSLIRAFEAVVLRAHLDRLSPESLNDALLQTIVSKLLAEEKKELITLEKIVKTVSDFYGIRSEDILGKSQAKECNLPRQVAIYLARQHLKLPFMKLGEAFGRDHSTILTSAKAVKKKIERGEKEISASVAEISRTLISS